MTGVADILASGDNLGYGGDIERKLRAKVALGLMQQGSSAAPVQHWTQGLARLAQALSGGVMAGQIGADEAREEAKAQADYQRDPRLNPGGEAPMRPPTLGPRPRTVAALSGVPDEPSTAPTPYTLNPGMAPRDSQDTFRTPTDAMRPSQDAIRAAYAAAGGSPVMPAMANPTPAGAVPVQTQAVTPPASQVAQAAPPTGITSRPQVDPATAAYLRSIGGTKAGRLRGTKEIENLTSKDRYETVAGPDGIPIQVNRTTGQEAPSPRKDQAIVEVQYARNNWQQLGLPDPADPKAQEFWRDFAAKRLGGSGVNVSLSTEKKGQESLATKGIEAYTDAQLVGRESQKRMATYDRMLQAAESFKPGASAELRLSAQRWLKEAGFNVGPNVPEGEVLKMLGQQLAVHAQPKGQGAVSNFEREMFSKSLPNMLQSPEGFRKAVEIARSLEKFDHDTARIFRDSARKNNGIPNYLEVQDEIARLGSPLSDNQMMSLTVQPSKGGGTKGGGDFKILGVE